MVRSPDPDHHADPFAAGAALVRTRLAHRAAQDAWDGRPHRDAPHARDLPIHRVVARAWSGLDAEDRDVRLRVEYLVARAVDEDVRMAAIEIEMSLDDEDGLHDLPAGHDA